MARGQDSTNFRYDKDLHCVETEFAWKPKLQQRGVTETGKWVADGKREPAASKFPRCLLPLLDRKHRGAEKLEDHPSNSPSKM